MADNTVLNLGTGGDIISSDVLTQINGSTTATGEKVQRVKAGFGKDGSLLDVDQHHRLPMDVPGNVIFNPTFDSGSIDITDTWIVNGTNPPSVFNGGLSIGIGGASSNSYLNSFGSFRAGAGSFLHYTAYVAIPALGALNFSTAFGIGTVGSLGTEKLAFASGVSFQVRDGNLFACMSQSTTAVSAVQITAITGVETNSHLYEIYTDGVSAYFYVDNSLVATTGPLGSNFTVLPTKFDWVVINAAASNASFTGSASTFIRTQTLTDTGHSAVQLTDGLLPWRKARVSAAGALSVAASPASNASAASSLTATDAVVAAPDGAGTIVSGASTAGSVNAIVIPDGYDSWTLMLKGYTSGTVYTEGSLNSTTGTDGDWIDLKCRRTGTAPGIESVTFALISNGVYRGNCAGFKYLRARLIGATGVTTLFSLSTAIGPVFLNSGIPTGGSIIGKVGIDQTTPGTTNAVSITNASLAVTGAFFQATQPVSAASLPLPAGAATEATLAARIPVNGQALMAASIPVVIASNQGALPVTGTFFQATQPVSLTVLPSLVAGSSIVGKFGIDQTTPGTTNNFTLSTPVGVAIGARSDGFLRVQVDPTTLLFDTFETLDTTNTWTIGGTVLPTSSSGNLSFGAGATASASSYASSKATFTPAASAYLQFSSLITLDAAASTGTNRFWGLGVFTTPTSTLPITNGVIFEVDAAAGVMMASVYSNSVRTQQVNLTKPTDGAVHRYAIYYKASKVYYEIDNVIVATTSFPNPGVSALMSVVGQANGATVTGTNTLSATLVGVGDTGRNAFKMADGLFPWRTVTIKQASAAAVATDNSLVVGFSPNSPLPTGSNIIGTVKIIGLGLASNTTNIVAATPANTPSVAADQAGNVTFTIKNTIAGTAYVGAPVFVFEQSDDGTSWGPLVVSKTDTQQSANTFTLGAGVANTSISFNSSLQGVNFVRVRCTTAPTTNGLTIVTLLGGLPFAPMSSVVQQPLTRFVQGTTGVSTQDLKDSGRVNVSITTYQAAGIITTEALFAAATFSSSRDGATATTGVQSTVASGKRFRIQSIVIEIKNTAAAAFTSKLALRYLAAGGTITNTSPILGVWDLGSNNAVAANYVGPVILVLPDGVELIPNSTFGFTNLSNAVTNLHTISLFGYEY
jgi:hypothetical protein